eukprot:g10602.t1
MEGISRESTKRRTRLISNGIQVLKIRKSKNLSLDLKMPSDLPSAGGKKKDNATRKASAAAKEQFEIVQYLVKTCTNKVDLIGQTDSSDGMNSLHFAAMGSEKNVQTLQFLIDNYNGNIKTIINQKIKSGATPLDCAYGSPVNSPIKNDIVSLLRKYGGKANCCDKNGNFVGIGKGDLND